MYGKICSKVKTTLKLKNNLDVSFQTSKFSDRLREQKIEPDS